MVNEKILWAGNGAFKTSGLGVEVTGSWISFISESGKGLHTSLKWVEGQICNAGPRLTKGLNFRRCVNPINRE